MNHQSVYRDLKINGLAGQPEIVALNANTFFVSDWNGVIRRVDWNAETVDSSPSSAGVDGMAGATLRSLCATDAGNMVGSATSATWAAIWDLNTGTLEKVHSDNGQPVNTVCFSPDGKFLVLGTGFYPLDPAERVEAAIEVWSHQEDKWKLDLVAALPGVCIDWLGWHATSNSIMAQSGRRTQDGCYLNFLDATTLRPRRVAEHCVFPSYVCGLQDCPPAVVVYGEELTMIHGEGSEEEDWSLTVEHDLNGGCLDDEEILTTTGHFIDFRTGKVTEDLTPLENCCRVALRPGGGYLGIATNGLLRVWEEPS